MNSKNKFNIFIVDDNKIFTLSLKAVIENEFGVLGFTIEVFENGEDCVEYLDQIKPDLIILDYYLNSKILGASDGLKILDQIKARSPATNVIMITSNNEIDVALKSFHHGAIDYVIKDNNQFENIIDSIRNLLKKIESEFLSKKRYKEDVEMMLADTELAIKFQEKEKRVAELKIVSFEKAEMERSKLEAEEKNKNITDSINYAWRIQKAKLPIREEISAALPNSFVLFKPKDIVSGDFYFFSRKEDRVIIVAADCTGHGVPGAFMSMIGSERLSEAVAISSNTSEILKHLNLGIKRSLNQSDSRESTRDGMDIAICSIDLNERTVEYAGANRPFWFIRNGSSQVEEIKGTKKAIGGLTRNDQYFESHEIKLQTGDTFYIATDGYADQFGGKYGKKLMTKLFKETLCGIQEKSMQEQEVHLDSFVEDWKSGAEQVDDILVIGVRL